MAIYIKAPGGEALDGTPTQTPHVEPDSQTMPLNIPRTKGRGNKIVVWFQYKNHQDHKVIRKVVGREAQALMWLHEVGPKGITTREARHWAWSLSVYVHDLRHIHGLSIRTVNEAHNGGWHGRYVLESPIVILQHKPTA